MSLIVKDPFFELLHKSVTPQRLLRSRTQSALLFGVHTAPAGPPYLARSFRPAPAPFSNDVQVIMQNFFRLQSIHCRRKKFCMTCTSLLMGACGIFLQPPDPNRWCMNTV